MALKSLKIQLGGLCDMEMEKELRNEKNETPSGTGRSIPKSRVLMRQIMHILYMIFNGACISVYGYQVYLWVKQSAWTNIPTRVLLPSGAGHPLSSQTGITWKITDWMLNVELAYTLCIVAMIFYGLRWMADRQVQ